MDTRYELVLLTLALIKGLVMAFVVAAITGSLIDTLVITTTSASVTGVFLLANTILQDRLIRRHAERVQHVVEDKVDEVKEAMK